MLFALLAIASVSAVSPARLTVKFAAPPQVHFNRRGDSTLTVTVGQGRNTTVLNGVPDPTDPENVYLRLKPVTLILDQKFNGTVSLKARLFLCDAKNGVCTVEELETRVRLRPGQQLGLVWPVGENNR